MCSLIITRHRSLKHIAIMQSLSLKETPPPVIANVKEAVNLHRQSGGDNNLEYRM